MKLCIDNNPDLNFFYSTEDEFKSNKPEVPNTERYFIRQVLGSDQNECFITKDGEGDQTEFDDDYKTLPRAIETL